VLVPWVVEAAAVLLTWLPLLLLPDFPELKKPNFKPDARAFLLSVEMLLAPVKAGDSWFCNKELSKSPALSLISYSLSSVSYSELLLLLVGMSPSRLKPADAILHV